MYFPADSRTRCFVEAGLPPQPYMPMLEDQTPIPLRPKDGARAMRENYNRATPMHMVLPDVWLGGKLAGVPAPSVAGGTPVGERLANEAVAAQQRAARRVAQKLEEDAQKCTFRPQAPRALRTFAVCAHQAFAVCAHKAFVVCAHMAGDTRCELYPASGFADGAVLAG